MTCSFPRCLYVLNVAIESSFAHGQTVSEHPARAALRILGPLGSLLSWVPPKYKEVRYLQTIVQEDVINPSIVILAKDFMMFA